MGKDPKHLNKLSLTDYKQKFEKLKMAIGDPLLVDRPGRVPLPYWIK